MNYIGINIEFGTYYIGDLDYVISSIFTISKRDNEIHIQAKYYEKTKFHSYSNEWTDEEIHRDIIQELFNKLKNRDYPKWIIFKEIQ